MSNMSISALPDSTVQLLGSPGVIKGPATLVKELLDNAIDAKATAVEILVSEDTIAKVEVRDNGAGIHPDDYDSLGRRGHTSKLRTFEELKVKAGSTLGFRGVALAEANAMANITVTTKTAQDPVGAILQIVPGKGGVAKQKSTSAPVGTTVSATGLFSRIPVREQLAIKDSSKEVIRIKDLLQSYVMARPQLKLSFRILKSAKSAWLYSPTRNTNVKEAVTQLLGSEASSQCIEKTFPQNSSQTPGAGGVTSPSQYTFEALVINSQANIDRIPKCRFFSVDGRPVTPYRPAMKKLFQVYLKYFGGALRKSDPLKEAFLRLDIRCAPGTYDVNVEPSKDDVLFVDEQSLIREFEQFCKSMYGEGGCYQVSEPPLSTLTIRLSGRKSTPALESPSNQCLAPSHKRDMQNAVCLSGPQNSSTVYDVSDAPNNSRAGSLRQAERAVEQANTFEATERRRDQDARGTPLPATTTFDAINSMPMQKPNGPSAIDPAEAVPNRAQAHWMVDMSTDLAEDVEETTYPSKRARLNEPTSQAPDAEANSEETSTQHINPWTIARMTAPNHHPSGSRTVQSQDVVASQQASPRRAALTPEPEILRHYTDAPRDLDLPPGRRHLSARIVPGGPYRSPLSSPAGPRLSGVEQEAPRPQCPEAQYHNSKLLLTPPSSLPRGQKRQHHYRPGPRVPEDGLMQTTISFNENRRGQNKRRCRGDDRPSIERDLPHLRNGDMTGIRSCREIIPPSGHQLDNQSRNHCVETRPGAAALLGPSSPSDQPHDLRQRFAHLPTTAFQHQGNPLEGDSEPIKTSLPTGDPRAYLLRRQKSIAAEESGAKPRRFRRVKSSLMPLVNVPEEDQTHRLVLSFEAHVQDIITVSRQFRPHDTYITTGGCGGGLDMGLDDGRIIEQRIKDLLSAWSEKVTGEKAMTELNLGVLLKGKGMAVGF